MQGCFVDFSLDDGRNDGSLNYSCGIHKVAEALQFGSTMQSTSRMAVRPPCSRSCEPDHTSLLDGIIVTVVDRLDTRAKRRDNTLATILNSFLAE